MRTRRDRRYAAALLALGLLLAVSGAAPAPTVAGPAAQGVGSILSTWEQLGPRVLLPTPPYPPNTFSFAIARAVVTESAPCPKLIVNGVTPQQSMDVRAAPAAPAWPVRVCEQPIPEGATARIEGQTQDLPPVRANPQRIAIVGDTGCRIESRPAPPKPGKKPHGRNIQNCNDLQQWPFAGIAGIAQKIANEVPDLVIHLGDVNDRDAQCPNPAHPHDPACQAGRPPTGDTWEAWNQDFLGPAAAFLRVAPLVIVRGNHEECVRFGEPGNGGGWFRLLDPHPYPPPLPYPANMPCRDYSDPYAVAFGTNLQLLVLDSAHASNGSAPSDQVAAYTPQIQTLRQAALSTPSIPAWFVTHKGVRTMVHGLQSVSQTLQAAGATNLPHNVQLTLAGHEHFFEVLSFNKPSDHAAPPQIVNTSGGDMSLGTPPPASSLRPPGSPRGVPDADTTVRHPFTVQPKTFGFMVVTPEATDWLFSLRNEGATQIASCKVDKGGVFDVKCS